MDPDLSISYAEVVRSADRHQADVEELDNWIRDQIELVAPEERKLVTTHDAFSYFGRRYGLEVVGSIWGITTEREPSAREVARLVDAIRHEKVPVVFVESTVNPRLIEAIARDAGVMVGQPLYGDSVGPPTTDAGTYLGMIRSNTRRIVAGLTAGAPD